MIWKTHYANNLDAFVPEIWAMESVAILVENMVAANLVHRDFEDEFANFGDVVNTRKPAEFTAKRKDTNDNVTIQDASATNIPVKLDQHLHTSFLIRDGEETKSFKSLVDEYLRPATISLARVIDQIVLGQVYQFLENQSNSMGSLTSANAVTAITNTGLVMDKNKAPIDGRHKIWTPEAQTLIIQNPTFHQADRVGDDGTALRDASLGRKLNFFHWMAQNMSQIDGVSTPDTFLINAGNLTKGSTVLTVDAGSAGAQADADVVGRWVDINGKVYHITGASLTTGAGTITLEYGLVEAIANNDGVNVYTSDANAQLASTLPVGHSKEVRIDDGSAGEAPQIQVGQMVTFANQTARYSVIEVTLGGTFTDILLDRPLETAVVDNDLVNYGPDGAGYNFAFQRNAVSLVIRPLQNPRQGTGALSGGANMAGVTMRVVITYDGDKQGHLVTLDFLAGIKVLDTLLGSCCLS